MKNKVTKRSHCLSVAALVLLLSALTHTSAVAQTNVVLRGQTVNCADKEIGLYTYSDQLSQEEILLDNTLIDSTQSFELKTYINYPTLVFVQIENYSQSFYIEPGRTYDIYIPRFDWNMDESRNVYLDPEALTLEFMNLPPDELNLQIGRFDEFVDSFVQANIYFFDNRFRPQGRYFDTLVKTVEETFTTTDNEFFERYKRYTLAQMRYQFRFTSRRATIEKQIAMQPILYYDESYMSLFFSLFENSISKGTGHIGLQRLIDWVDHCDLDRMLDSLGLDPLLRNEQVRELAALQALKEAYYSRHYRRDNVLCMVERLATETKFPDHRKLANNLMLSFRKLEKGVEVPSVTLLDVDKNPVSLDAFRGKWVYLSFVRVSDPNSLSEIRTLAHFRDSVYSRSSNIEFVTIDCDREFQKMYHFLRNNPHGSNRYNWTWLHFGGNFRLLEQFGVVSYPTFLLINPEGELHFTITPPPASGILLNGPWEPRPKQEAPTGTPFYQLH
ncbi:MAG: redoxin domain-containing protein [Bacteroidales bacterium]|nr:redoxin domain-containing protein [Bacteroidales bacterium]